ncbi:MAG TPA: RnfABCDGE type electron transport complex subunit D, partial [Devosia sp.]|nr:RnfABCDGE type electron transport complex subunit D [Devosia sp.]
MIALIDRLIDRITMYRLVLWYLVALVLAAAALGALHRIAIDPMALALSSVLVLAGGWIANQIFARVFGAIPNIESVYITGLIIVLIMDPAPLGELSAAGAIVFASAWAMASKFIFSLRRRHIFNPAAIGVALPALLLDHPATWWVSGQLWLMPVVVIGGLLIVRKLRRFDLVLAFAAANLLVTVLTGNLADAAQSVRFALLDSPFFFFAFVMLTEPLTAPQSKLWRIVYGALVGALAAPNVAIAGYYFTPEVALLVGNLLTLVVSPQGRVVLTLERIEQAAAGVYDYVFRPDRALRFAAGQYLEWTLQLPQSDSRGNRRYFTIASAPADEEMRLGVKFAPNGSAFKRGLSQLQPGDQIVASQLAGSFTLPRNKRRKLAFIAGGIGITPFRSMLDDLLERGEARPIKLLYGNNRIDEVAYADVLKRAREELGIPTYYAVRDPEGATSDMTVGYIDAAMIEERVPDYRERIFYISGPQAMVNATRRTLRELGIPTWRIKTDFFPG